LAKKRYLTGGKFTWLDLRLFHTLIRFDPVYVFYSLFTLSLALYHVLPCFPALFTVCSPFFHRYHTYFKTNQKRIADYPNLLGFVRDV
jgi:glutathionyl-hydroquinone reductase